METVKVAKVRVTEGVSCLYCNESFSRSRHSMTQQQHKRLCTDWGATNYVFVLRGECVLRGRTLSLLKEIATGTNKPIAT